jgi:hypothetical protein
MSEPSRIDRTAGTIDWPAWAGRTPAGQRASTAKYSVSFADALDAIEAELEDRLGVDGYRVSTAAPHRTTDGRPYADANPDDPGVVVRWSRDGRQYAVACDYYTTLRDNARTIGLWIKETRKRSDRPVHTGQDEFAAARLPAEEATPAEPAPHRVLGVEPGASDETVVEAFREQVKEVHPDSGGSTEAYQRLQAAKDELLGDSTHSNGGGR